MMDHAKMKTLQISILAHDLKLELNCTVALLGIQPASNEAGERVSPEVWQAMHQVTNGLDELISSQPVLARTAS